MHLGDCHEKCSKEWSLLNEHFNDGIINGAEWYALYGGMQDWNYLHTNCYEITVEMGCRKYPPAKDLSRLWQDNRQALLTFIDQVHRGIKGVVRDVVTNMSLVDVTITVQGFDHSVRSVEPYGDFWRLLQPGVYQVTANKTGFKPVTKTISIPDGQAEPVWVEFNLNPKSDYQDSNAFLLLMCFLIIILIVFFIVIACCPGLVQQVDYMLCWRRKSSPTSASSQLINCICCCCRKRTKRPNPDESFHYTKLNATEINLDSDEDEDMAFDVNHLLRK